MSSAQWSSDAPYNVDNSYVECSIIGFPARSPTQFWQVVYVNDSLAAGDESRGSQYVSGQWVTVDASHWVPAGTKAICIDGLILLTHPNTGDISQVTAAFRRNGETYDFPYIGQTEDVYNSGMRSNMGCWVTLDANYKFQIKYFSQGRDTHGISLRVTAYAR